MQTKLQSSTLTYNGGFQNKMHHILVVLKLESPYLIYSFTFVVFEIVFLHVLVWITKQQTT